jgi:hypothetical protein
VKGQGQFHRRGSFTAAGAMQHGRDVHRTSNPRDER